MSFMLTIYLKDGVVMASSRQLTNEIFANNENKSFQKCVHKTHNNIGISVFGNAVYDYENLIETFILLNNNELTSVTDFTYKFKEFLMEMDLQSEICFHISGYEKIRGNNTLVVLKLSYPDCQIVQLNTYLDNKSVAGVAWVGEEDVENEVFKPMFTVDFNGDKVKLPEYSLPWELFSVDEAINFAYLAIKNSFEFKRRTISSAMEVPPIDILTITQQKAELISNNPDEVVQELVQTC